MSVESKESIEWLSELDEEAYSDYLAEIGEIDLSNNQRKIRHFSDVDEWNEMHGDDWKMPYEDPTDYVEIFGALEPAPPEWTPEELGYDEDGYLLVDEMDKPPLPDD